MTNGQTDRSREISNSSGQRTKIFCLVPDTTVDRQVSDINLLVWVTVHTKHPHTNSVYTSSGQNKQSLVVLEARIFPTVQWEGYFWLHGRVLFRVCVKLLKPDYSRPYVHNWPLKNLLRSNKYHQSLTDWEIITHHHDMTSVSFHSLLKQQDAWKNTNLRDYKTIVIVSFCVKGLAQGYIMQWEQNTWK